MVANRSDPIFALQLDTIASVNVWLAIGACAYASISAVLLLINFLQCKTAYFDIFNEGCGASGFEPIASGDTVHRIEFTSAFLFNCVNLLIVAYSESKAKFTSPTLFKTWAFINLLFSSTAMILVWTNRSLFEVPAHQMEYISEISMSFLETKLLQHGIEAYIDQGSWKHFANALNYLPFSLACLQLFVFNKGSVLADVPADWKGDCSFVRFHLNFVLGSEHCTHYGDAWGEWYAHCLEYVVGFMNAMQAFFIAMDSRNDAKNRMDEIIPKSTRSVTRRLESDSMSRGTYQPPASVPLPTVFEGSTSVASPMPMAEQTHTDVEQGAAARCFVDSCDSPLPEMPDPHAPDLCSAHTAKIHELARQGAEASPILAGKPQLARPCHAKGCSGFVPENPDPHAPDYCEEHALKMHELARKAICNLPGCGKHTWDGKPGFCGTKCKTKHKQTIEQEILEIDREIKSMQAQMEGLRNRKSS